MNFFIDVRGNCVERRSVMRGSPGVAEAYPMWPLFWTSTSVNGIRFSGVSVMPKMRVE